MSGAIRTTGDLRGFLAEVLKDVREGRVDPHRASAISKIASQINDSFATETQTALISLKLGFDNKQIGDMPLLPNAPEPVSRVIEHKPVQAIQQKPPGERTFCDQCDRNVTVGEAVACKSAFCKAKEAA